MGLKIDNNIFLPIYCPYRTFKYEFREFSRVRDDISVDNIIRFNYVSCKDDIFQRWVYPMS